MEPYVIRKGDFLLKLAYTFDFDANTVWNDATNAGLRQIRSDPNILLPGDVLYIPDQVDKEPAFKSLVTGGTNTFTSDVPTMTLTHQFAGDDPTTYASKAYTVEELDDLTGLQTNENGVATFPVPLTLETATITFTDTEESFVLAVGEMDPINTISGVFKRLQNLGYIDEDVAYSASDPSSSLDVVRFGLVLFDAVQSGAGDAPDASSPDDTSDSTADGDPDDWSEVADLADDGALDPDTLRQVLDALSHAHGC
jgi:hypothetical protein